MHQQTNEKYIPPGCFPLEHQVAGHFSSKNNAKLGMLQTNDGCVLKAIQSRLNGKRELDFFIRIFCTEDLNEHEINLRKFLPIYRGYLIYNSSKLNCKMRFIYQQSLCIQLFSFKSNLY